MTTKRIAPWLGLGFVSRSGLVLGLGATRQLPPRKVAPRLGLGFGLGLVLGLGAIFLWGNRLEPNLVERGGWRVGSGQNFR